MRTLFSPSDHICQILTSQRTGCLEPSACLVMTSSPSKEYTSILFVAEKDPNRETWDGIMTGPERAKEYFGVSESHSLSSLRHIIRELSSSSAHVFADSSLLHLSSLPFSDSASVFRDIQMSLFRSSAVNAESAWGVPTQLDSSPSPSPSLLSPSLTSSFNFKASYSSHRQHIDDILSPLLSPSSSPSPSPSEFSPPNSPLSLHPLSPLLHIMRGFKSPAEIQLMKDAMHITSNTFQWSMRVTRPNMNEHQLMSSLQYASQMRGALRLSYPPVVACGPNALILHYITSDEPMGDGETVLVDAGAQQSVQYDIIFRDSFPHQEWTTTATVRTSRVCGRYQRHSNPTSVTYTPRYITSSRNVSPDVVPVFPSINSKLRQLSSSLSLSLNSGGHSSHSLSLSLSPAPLHPPLSHFHFHFPLSFCVCVCVIILSL